MQECMVVWKENEVSLNQQQLIPPNIIRTFRSGITRLPLHNFCLLQLLCQHLKRVADNEKETKMNTSNLMHIFIPTLNIDRVLFQCMVKHYHEVFENGEEKPAGPQRFHNLLMDTKSTSVVTIIPKRVVHIKTMPNTGVYISSLNTSLSSSNMNKTLSPKPIRITLSPNTAQIHHTRQPPPLSHSNSRSKSVSLSSRNHTVLLSVPILKNLDEPD
jgi:hypothetical protein